MDGSGASTDPEYEHARKDAEERFYIGSVKWEEALLKQAEQLPVAPQADTKKFLENIAAAAWKGEPLPVKPQPSVSHELILGLITLCHDFVKTDMIAFSALRLTNAFSKTCEHHWAAVACWFAFYNFCRVHKSLRITPAMAADIADHVWSVWELLA